MIDLLDALCDSSADFHSVVVLTYRLDLEVYDGLLRRALNRAGVTNQVVFCDYRTYVEELAMQLPRFIGRHYSVVPVHQKGAFHPKVYALFGVNRGRVLVGSGNTTVGGLLRNAEVFGQFDYIHGTDTGPHPVFGELVSFINQLSQGATKPTKRQLEQAVRGAGWLQLPSVDDGRNLLIGGEGRRPMFDQMLEHLPAKGADSLLLCSSSFDRSLSGLTRLAKKVRKPPVCIVQSDRAEIDGRSVTKLGKLVDWREFKDPNTQDKRKRRDVYAHAKFYVFRHGAKETTIFGSPNASEPALMGPNTEVAVALPPAKAGQTVETLNLANSLKHDARAILSKRQWIPDEFRADAFPCVLLGVSAGGSQFQLALGNTLPQGAKLALATGPNEKPVAMLALRPDGDQFASETFEPEGPLGVGWVVSTRGLQLSNLAAITWAEVAQPRRASGLSSKLRGAIQSIHDGSLAGTILFELLDAFRDFEVLRVASRTAIQRHPESGGDEPAQERPPEFFYTDARVVGEASPHWSGDRLDLDLLASLIQPTPARSPSSEVDDQDEEFDDGELEEEAERRQLDADRKGDAEPGHLASSTSRIQLEKAIRRLERRFDRAAGAMERSLEHLSKLQSVPALGVARQTWMTQIGAFLVSREMEADDGTQLGALAPVVFAQYVIRLSRALAGSRRGAFLDRIAKDVWDTSDGAILRKGLGFLRSSAMWATAVLLEDYRDTYADGEDWPGYLACAVPELVAARLIAKLDSLGIPADEEDFARRFPAWDIVEASTMRQTRLRLEGLAATIDAYENQAKGPVAGGSGLVPGSLVFSEHLGVTAVMDVAGSYVYLADCSKHADEPSKYAAAFVNTLPASEGGGRVRCWYVN